jgi:hypothetical protein
MTVEKQEEALKQALHLIKLHIGSEQTPINRDLHHAVQLIVTVARQNGFLSR